MLFLVASQIDQGPDPEINRAIALAMEQAIHQEEQKLEAVVDEGKSFRKPSKIKYGFLIICAVIKDLLDILAIPAAATVAGYFVLKAISVVISVLILAVFWFTRTKQKRAEKYIDEIGEVLAEIQENIAHYTRLALRTAKIARRVPGGGRIARQVPRLLVRARRVARKNPITKLLFASALDLVPIIDVVPWTSLGVALSYLDERKSFQNAYTAASEAEEMVLEPA
ncbi:MAG TPA: hypothetical protein VJJ72_02410 [Candidatus Paceibacterota bacterium]